MGGVHHAEALRLLAAIEPRTAPGVGLTARERLELGLLPSDDDARGIDSLHAAAVASFGLPDSHEAVTFGTRCLSALGELCRELECSERLGLIGGHQMILRLMTEGHACGDARGVQPARSGTSEFEVEVVECSPAGVCAPTAATSRNNVGSGHPAVAEEVLEGEEDEVQSAAALVAANVVSSGSSFPMRASFPTEEGSSGLGRFPLQYDFVASGPCAVECTDRVHSSATAISAAATQTDSVPAAGERRPLDGESFSILVRPVKERQHSQFDVGFVMWPAAVILSRLLCRHPELVRGRRVLEIGAGLGLAGLVAAHLQQTSSKLAEPSSRGSVDGRGGASSVTLSDFNPLVLRALEANVALNAGRAAGDAGQKPATAGSGCGREGHEDGFRQQARKLCGEDGGAPAGQSEVRVRHLDWDKLEDAPSVEGGRSNSAGEGRDRAQASGPSPGRACDIRDFGDGWRSDDDSVSGEALDGSTSGQREESGGGWTKGIKRGERFDLIIASDHICQASDAEGTIRVLHAMLAEATPAPAPTTVRTPSHSPAGSQATCSTGSSEGSGSHPASDSAQQQQLFGPGGGYSPAGGGHAHLVVAHPRTRWGVDALVPLLREAPGLSFTCEEVSDPGLVAGLEEASYLAWLHVHVWREAAPPGFAAGDGFDEDGVGEVAAEAAAADEALLVVG